MDGGTGMIDLPSLFLKRMEILLGKEMPDFLHAMECPPVRGIRMNPFKPFDGLEHYTESERIPWTSYGYYLPVQSKAGATVFHEAGAFYLQEPAAMLPGEVMDVQPGERILDLCAAPGGKSTQMGLKLKGEGWIVSNEPVYKRAQILSRNMERMGIPNSIVTCAYPAGLPQAWNELFDGVLADVPCSGEGMFRRDPMTRTEWSAEKTEGCVKRQREILNDAARLVIPGGRLVYSTCTYHPDENEGMVEWFLKTHPEFTPESFSLPGVSGREGMFLCLPHRMKGEGQFVAKLRKKGDPSHTDIGNPFERIQPKDAELLMHSIPGIQMPNHRIGNSFIGLSECPDVRGIQVLRAGLKIAETNGRKITPDHAAALSFNIPSVQPLELNPDEVRKYLAGQEICHNGTGWLLMRYRGLAIGWGKGSDGRIRNHYPKGLRKENILTEAE